MQVTGKYPNKNWPPNFIMICLYAGKDVVFNLNSFWRSNMKSIIKLAAACVVAISLVACASGPTKTLDEANMAIKSAMTANGKAKKMYVEWRDTGKMLKKARKAKGKGDFDKAVKLANKAEKQAKNAVAQAKAQSKNLNTL